MIDGGSSASSAVSGLDFRGAGSQLFIIAASSRRISILRVYCAFPFELLGW